MTNWNIEKLFSLADQSKGLEIVRRQGKKAVLIASDEQASKFLERCYAEYMEKMATKKRVEALRERKRQSCSYER